MSVDFQEAGFKAHTPVYFCICSQAFCGRFFNGLFQILAFQIILSNFFQIEDFNAHFSQIKYFQSLQLADKRTLSLKYPQSWLVDWGLFVGNLERQVSISEVRWECDKDAFEGSMGKTPFCFNMAPSCGGFILLLQQQQFCLNKNVNVILTLYEEKKATYT